MTGAKSRRSPTPPSIALVTLLLALVVGCFSAPPERTVIAFFDAMKRGDIEKAVAFIEPSTVSAIAQFKDRFKEYNLRLYLSRLKYEIVSVQRKDSTAAVVRVRLAAPDLLRIGIRVLIGSIPGALAAVFSDNPSMETQVVQQILERELNDPEAPTLVTDLEIALKKEGGRWLIILDERLADAIMGNAIDELDELFSGES